jgi:hypothetical protein
MIVLLVWASLSWVYQRVLNRVGGRIADGLRWLWTASDGLAFTWLLTLATPPREPMYIGYALLIIAVGLWGRISLVWFMTGMSVAAQVWLMSREPGAAWPAHYPFLVAAQLVLTGGFVAFQVRRLRVLGNWFDRKRGEVSDM